MNKHSTTILNPDRKFYELTFAFLLNIGFFLVYVFNLYNSTPFIGDMARDMYDILQISLGDFRLIGPKLSFGGIYSAPWYYYLFVPIYLVFGKSFAAVLYFNAFIHSSALGILFYMVGKKWGIIRSLLVTTAVAVLPLYVFSARNPGNAFTYQPFLILLLVWVFVNEKWGSREVLLTGLAAGFIASFHVILVLIFLPAWLYLLFKRKFRQVFLLAIGFVIPFIPLVLFELKHNFIMLKNTFVDQSYKMFTENQNIPDREASPSNLIANFFFMNSQLTTWTVLGPLILLSTGIIGNLKNKINGRWLGWGIASYLIFTFLSRYQFAIHYLLPLGLTILVLTFLTLHKSWLFYPLTVILLVFGISKIDWQGIPNSHNYESVSGEVSSVIKNSRFDKESFNVVNIDLSGRSSVGNQYRYFFLLEGLMPKNEYQFAESHSLLVFTAKEYSKQKLQQLDNYEIRQFGKQYLNTAKLVATQESKVFVLQK